MTLSSCSFFFLAPPPTATYTLSLHDALPIFADDDTIGPHTKRVDHELALFRRALAFHVRRTRFQPHDVLLVELKLGRVFDRADALAIGDERREHIQQRRLSGAGAAAHQTVEPRVHAVAEKPEHIRRQRLETHQVVGLQTLGWKSPDGEEWAVDGQRRNDGVHARSVRQPRVYHRRAVVD